MRASASCARMLSGHSVLAAVALLGVADARKDDKDFDEGLSFQIPETSLHRSILDRLGVKTGTITNSRRLRGVPEPRELPSNDVGSMQYGAPGVTRRPRRPSCRCDNLSVCAREVAAKQRDGAIAGPVPP